MAASPDAAAQPQSQPRERVLVLTRVLEAPRALVFTAWSRPEHLARWWGPKGFTLPSCKMEFRSGGAFRCVMRSPAGSDHTVEGVYREIVEPERLVFTWGWIGEDGRRGHETLVTVTLEEAGKDGAKTKLTLHQALFESVTARDAHEGGWTESLERLAAYVTTA